MMDAAERALRFDREHARNLRALAYRMLGSRTEAEDIVQEAWLRWAEVDETSVHHVGAYLSRLVTNLCLDKLGSAAARREKYVGIWLPEPLVNDEAHWTPGPDAQAEFAQDVSVAFLLALERLSPLERAAFLLHDVFDRDFDEVGRCLDRSPEACRQLASRAREHVRADYTRCEVGPEEHQRLFLAFSEALRNLDVDALADVLAEGAVMLSDGGGKANAVPYPLQGSALIAKALIGFGKRSAGRARRFEPGRVNGEPGCLMFDGESGRLIQTVGLRPSVREPGRIDVLYIQRNPDKLTGILAATRASI